jgi:S1-C subfamily serine protease
MKLDITKLREKLTELKTKAVNTLTLTLKLAARIAVTMTSLACLVYVAARAPEMHGYWIRSKVGAKSYLIYEPKVGGGSGFAITAPSGETYIVTNDHVCAVSRDSYSVMVKDEDDNRMRRRIIARSERSDLCLIEGMPGIEGLSVANFAPSIGQIIASVGHPAGYDTTMSRGEVIMRRDVGIAEGPISVINPRTGKEEAIPAEEGGITEEQCSLPKNRIVVEDVPFFWFVLKVKMCITVTEGAYFTNMLIQPGSSGSPVVNFFGNVVGVVFASDQAGWGVTISHKDLVDFLKPY